MREKDMTKFFNPSTGNVFCRRSMLMLGAAFSLSNLANVIPAIAQSRQHSSEGTLNEGTANAIERSGGSLVIALWEAKEGQADAVAAILRRFLPQAQSDPGAKLFLIARGKDNPSQFFFFELFADDAAIAAHRASEYFKTMILGEALPLLSKREGTQYSFL